MFEGLSNIAGLMKNARELQSRAQEMKARLSELRVEGVAGGGMVRVEASGDQRITGLTIDPELLASGDREMLEDLLVGAINQSLDQAREAATQEMSQLAGGLNMPGLSEALSKLGLGS